MYQSPESEIFCMIPEDNSGYINSVNDIPATEWPKDFHPLDCARAGHNIKKRYWHLCHYLFLMCLRTDCFCCLPERMCCPMDKLLVLLAVAAAITVATVSLTLVRWLTELLLQV